MGIIAIKAYSDALINHMSHMKNETIWYLLQYIFNWSSSLCCIWKFDRQTCHRIYNTDVIDRKKL